MNCPINHCFNGFPNRPMEFQADLRGQGPCCGVSGRVRISPMGSGSALSAQVRGLPCGSRFFSLSIQCACRREELPSLMACGGEAMLSVYLGGVAPWALDGCQVVLSAPGCGCGEQTLASGTIRPRFGPDRPPLDPRPLFAPPCRR